MRTATRVMMNRQSLLWMGLFLGLVSMAGGCGYRSKARVVGTANMDDPRTTRIHNFMSTKFGSVETDSDSLIDEAVIAVLEPHLACFDLTIRSSSTVDIHPSQWEVTVNGTLAHVEEIADRDDTTWTVTRTEQEVVYQRESPRGTTTMTVPVEREYERERITRYARACAPINDRRNLRLSVVLPHKLGDEDWGQTYEWQIAAPYGPPGLAASSTAAPAASATISAPAAAAHPQ